MTKEKMDTIGKILKEHSELFKMLSDGINCPECGLMVRGKKYNLGEKHNSFEGCKDCYNKLIKGKT